MARKPLDPAYRRHPIASALVSVAALALGSSWRSTPSAFR